MKKRDEVIIIEQKTGAGPDGCYILILRCLAAGKKNRYDVYRLPWSTRVGIHGGATVIGRELPLIHARKIANSYKKIMGVFSDEA